MDIPWFQWDYGCLCIIPSCSQLVLSLAQSTELSRLCVCISNYRYISMQFKQFATSFLRPHPFLSIGQLWFNTVTAELKISAQLPVQNHIVQAKVKLEGGKSAYDLERQGSLLKNCCVCKYVLFCFPLHSPSYASASSPVVPAQQISPKTAGWWSWGRPMGSSLSFPPLTCQC